MFETRVQEGDEVHAPFISRGPATGRFGENAQEEGIGDCDLLERLIEIVSGVFDAVMRLRC